MVLVIIDTLRADKLGCYGYPGESSPELDALAEGGVRFARVIAQSSWTRPSIGSLLTSRYPRELGIYREKKHALDGRFDTLPEILGRFGYKTLGATANPNVNSTFNFAQGFDVHIDSNVLWRWMDQESDKVSYQDRPIQSAREMFTELLERVEGKPGPFYLQATIMEAHEYADRRLLEDVQGDRLPASLMEPLYAEAVRRASLDVGWFVETLAALPGWENTLFIVTSDHGEGLADHPSVPSSQAHGELLYETQLHVPWILYSTSESLQRGQVVRFPVRLLDLLPTVLELVGLPVPTGIAGVSLVPALRGSHQPQLPPYFVAETAFRGRDKIAAYSADWKYIENRDGHPGTREVELQAIGGDEDGARTDVADQYPDAVRELAEYLRRWEERHARREPVLQETVLSDEEAEQLRALGYVGD